MGEDESEIPPFGGGSLIWHWGATAKTQLCLDFLTGATALAGNQHPAHEAQSLGVASTGSPEQGARSQPKNPQLDPGNEGTHQPPRLPGFPASLDTGTRPGRTVRRRDAISVAGTGLQCHEHTEMPPYLARCPQSQVWLLTSRVASG